MRHVQSLDSNGKSQLSSITIPCGDAYMHAKATTVSENPATAMPPKEAADIPTYTNT